MELLLGVAVGAAAGIPTGTIWYRWRLRRAIRHASSTLEAPPVPAPIDHDAVLAVLRQRGPGQ